MTDINVNEQLLDKQLINELSRAPNHTNDPDIQFLLASLENLKQFSTSSRKGDSFAVTKIPLDEIVLLLKDIYQGKVNQYLQEILNSAKIELRVDNIDPNNLKSARQLEVKIKLAATVIDKYADLITLAIGQKSSAAQSEVIEKARISLKKLNEQLNGINLLFLTSKLRAECLLHIDQYKPNAWVAFFCLDKGIKKLSMVEEILAGLMQQGFTTAETMGGILLLYAQIPTVFGTAQSGKNLSRSFNQLFLSSQYKINDTKMTEQMIKAYTNRANQLEVAWPKPFVLEITPLNAAEFPSWSPGIEAIR